MDEGLLIFLQCLHPLEDITHEGDKGRDWGVELGGPPYKLILSHLLGYANLGRGERSHHIHQSYTTCTPLLGATPANLRSPLTCSRLSTTTLIFERDMVLVV